MFKYSLSKNRVLSTAAFVLASVLSFQLPAQAAEGAAQDGVGLSESRDYQRTERVYEIPEATLRNRFDEDVRLDKLLAQDRPVLMQFIFTSCATICPVMSATFAQAQGDLVEQDSDTQLISISIDPEYDTPERLREYAKRQAAGDNWTFLTGEFDTIFRVVRAFDAIFESDNKMYHEPYTYLRAAPGEPWLRINGLVSVKTLLEEYRTVLAKGDDTLANKAASASE
ncbi:SCO family protein [Ferruginivarius sediminum]|uniref:SCO family protein n=1 Tax=Ferruginivarius sediminum TaxID=2661937 RepID=A0A369TFA0_9PROT|nr:SCO family protein [Ferruginivarius sediminum]RDD63055.1 SCO family protein [Ferruginivarius sediminum]